MKRLNHYPFWIEVVCLPISYVIAILKILVVIPMLIIALCNKIYEKIN